MAENSAEAFLAEKEQVAESGESSRGAEDLELLARLAKADCLGRTGDFDCSAMNWFLERARALGVEHEPPRPFLLGRHLLQMGLTPGPRIGKILGEVYERQLDGAVNSLDDAIEDAKEIIDRSS